MKCHVLPIGLLSETAKAEESTKNYSGRYIVALENPSPPQLGSPQCGTQQQQPRDVIDVPHK